jgi:hypothetical protein
MTLRIERSARQGFTVLTLSGYMEAAQVLELKELFDRDAVRFLKVCETDGMKLENCPAYVREWIDRERD